MHLEEYHMTCSSKIRAEILEATEGLKLTLSEHPECDARMAEDYIRRNKLRPYPLLTITPAPTIQPARLQELSTIKPANRTVEEMILHALLCAQLPAQAFNPVMPVLHLGWGPGTLAACFGIPLNAELGYQPVGKCTLDDLLAAGMPDVKSSGMIPQMREHIEAILMLTPEWVEIAPPDTQGPFNIAHMILGNEVFLELSDRPEMFAELMDMITDFYIAFYRQLRQWIGEARYTRFVNSRCRLRECSCNLISADMYLEHVLPHDRRIAEFFGEVCVHPCSGRHVFYATMRNLPNIVFHEAMPFDAAIAPSITVEEAVAEIGDKPVRLCFSRALEAKNAREMILRDFEMIRHHPAFVAFYTLSGMKAEDCSEVRALNRQLIDDWQKGVYAIFR